MALLDYLRARYRHSSEREWEVRIRAGQVRVDGRHVEPAHRLRAGDIVRWHRPPWREPDVPRAFEVLTADVHVLAVAKPAGLPTMPGGGYLANTLAALVKEGHPDATPLHRLGRGTSGIVLFARSDLARRALARDWRAGDVERSYLARVDGRMQLPAATITVPIGPVVHPRLGTIHAARRSGRPARSTVRVLDRDEATSLVEVRIATGRPHQIRIHLAAIGHPLTGDPLYGQGGVPRPGSDALPGDGGYLLHAHRIGFRHPSTGEPTTIDCAPPIGRLRVTGSARPLHAG